MVTVHSKGFWTLAVSHKELMILHRTMSCCDSDSSQEYLKTPCLGSRLDISAFYDKIQPNCEFINRKRQDSFRNFFQFFILHAVVIQLDVQHELLKEAESPSVLLLLKLRMDNKHL